MEDRTSFRVYDRFKPTDRYKAKFIHAEFITIKNISFGGMLIETTKRLSVNNKYAVQISSIDGSVSIKPDCIVLRSFLRGFANNMPLYEVALKFIDLDEKDKRSLEKIFTEFSKKSFR
jgi:hypothetical protein